MGISFELEPEQVDRIIVEELNYHLHTFNKDLELRKSGQSSLGVFSNNKDEDVAEITRHIEAINTILTYYSGNSTKF